MDADLHWMSLALELAEKAASIGEVPIGAVITYENKLVASAYNERERLRDPTAHAELTAIKVASERLGRWRLLDTTLYVTLEPCPMCAGALVNARIKRLVYAAADPKAGAVRSLYRIADDSRLNHAVEVVSGLCEEKARELLQTFFKKRRT